MFTPLLINDSRLVGLLKNTRFYDFLSLGAFAVIMFAVVIMIAGQVVDLFGVHHFGG
ncbi:MAG: hypothetical protein QOE96_3042 [Blastocatellia bacterium]|jgi:hypothetical protein|nr:hypothetical protein [Blastocatellia bacterium]